jgi:hypothetical protein
LNYHLWTCFRQRFQLNFDVVHATVALVRILCQATAHGFVQPWWRLGRTVEMRSGSLSRIAPSTLNCDLPSKARRPVTAS